MHKIVEFLNKNRIWICFIWMGVCVLCVLFLLVQLSPYLKVDDLSGGGIAVQKLDTAEVTVNGSTQQMTLPTNLSDLAPGTEVEVSFTFRNQRADSYMEVRTAFAPMTVEINGKQVFSCGEREDRPSFMKDPGTIVHFVPLQTLGNVRVTLHYTSPASRNSLSISALRVANQSGLFRDMMMRMGVEMAGSFVMLLFGILLTIVSFMVVQLDRSGMILLWLGGFMALTGLWGCSGSDMSHFFLNVPNLWYLLNYLSFFCMLLPLEYLVEESVKFRHKKPGFILRVIHMIAILTALVLQMTGTLMFPQSVRFFQVFLPVSVFFYTAMVIYEAVWRRNKAGMLWMMPMLIMCVSCIMELVYYANCIAYATSRYFLIGSLIFCIFMCMIGGVQIRRSIQVSRREREQEYQLYLMNREVDEQKKYQDSLLEHERELRRQRHDYRHQLTVLQEYLKEGRLDELKSYLEELGRAIPCHKDIRYTENIAINAVITYYVQMAENAGAKVKINIALPKDISHSMEQNLCVVFGNLLENAAEAVGRITGDNSEGGKTIALSALVHMGNLVIHMENSVGEKPRKWGRFFVSSKRAEVGIGLTSIANIASQNHGDAEFYCSNGLFISDVYFVFAGDSEGRLYGGS